MIPFLSASLMEVRDGNVLEICDVSLALLLATVSSLVRVLLLVMAETWEELDCSS